MRILNISGDKMSTAEPTTKGAGTLVRQFEQRSDGWWEEILVSPDPDAPDWEKVRPWMNERLNALRRAHDDAQRALLEEALRQRRARP